MKLLVRAASSASSGDPSTFYEVFKTNSWETLMTFTRENARMYYFPCREKRLSNNISLTASQPPPQSMDADMDDLPQEIKDQIAQMEGQASTGGSGGAGESSSGVRVCPHCTFENAHGGTDCEVCGLPLS